MNNEKLLKMLLNEKIRRSILITGDYGVGKTKFIIDFFKNDEVKNELSKKYDEFAILNASDITEKNSLEKNIFIKKDSLNKDKSEKTFNDKINIYKNKINQYKNKFKFLTNAGNDVGKKFLGIDVIHTLDNIMEIYEEKNILVVVDEVDRKIDKTSLKELFTKIINLQEKGENIKFIVILCEKDLNEIDKKLLKEWREKLFSKTLIYNNDEKLKKEYSMITDDTWLHLENLKINSKNFRVLEIADELFDIFDKSLKNITTEEMIKLKNEMFINLNICENKKDYISIKEKEFSKTKKDNKEIINIIISKDIERRRLNIIEDFIKGDEKSLYEFIKEKNNTEKNPKYLKDIDYFFDEIYKDVFTKGVSIEENSIRIMSEHIKEMPLVNSYYPSGKSFFYWSTFPFTNCIKVANVEKIQQLFCEKLRIEKENIINKKYNYEELIFFKNNFNSFIDEGAKNNKVKKNLLEYHKKQIDDLLYEIDTYLEKNIKYNFDIYLDEETLKSIFENHGEEFVRHFMNKEQTNILALRELKEKVGYKDEYIKKIIEITNKIYNTDMDANIIYYL